MIDYLGRLLLFVVLSGTISLALAGDASNLRVEVSGLQKADGNIYLTVYDSDDTWLGEEFVLQEKVAIAEARVDDLVHVELSLPQGEYAISIYHDSNDNGDLDTNWIGIPKEPVALSNNAKPRFGPPKYKDAVFTLGAEPVTQRIAITTVED